MSGASRYAVPAGAHEGGARPGEETVREGFVGGRDLKISFAKVL